MSTPLRRIAVVAGVLIGGLALAPDVDAAAVPPWTVIELQGLAEGESTFVTDINDAGVAIGGSDGLAVRWSAAGEPTALETPEGCDAELPHAISNAGHIVGRGVCTVGEDHVVGAFHWSPDGTLTVIPEVQWSEAVDDNGIVGGLTTGDGRLHAVVHLAGHPTLRLPEAGGAESFVGDLTSWGYVVGTIVGVPTLPDGVAVGWYGDQVFPLLLTGAISTGVAVNEAGVALVDTYTSDGRPLRGYLVAPGRAVTALDQSGDADWVQDVNDAGIVVGTKVLDDAGTPVTTDDDTTGAFYVGTQWVALENTLSPADQLAFDLSEPVALNNHAWVVGNTDGAAWLLKPPAAQLPHTVASVAS